MVDVGLPHSRRHAGPPGEDADLSFKLSETPPAYPQRGRKGEGPSGARRDFVRQMSQAQDRLEERFHRLGRGRYARVLKMARKPTPDEFRKTSIVAGAGILILGAIGFAFYLAFTFIPQ